MKLCSTPQQVVAAIAQPARIIAVDGIQLSGKTRLARELGSELGLKVIKADDYLNKNQGSFFSQLNLTALAKDLGNSGPCIFEGICCLQVLGALGESADHLIYVKRMYASGWADEARLDAFEKHGPPLLDDSESPDPLAVHLRNLWIEVASYHLRYQPHKTASLTYARSAA